MDILCDAEPRGARNTTSTRSFPPLQVESSVLSVAKLNTMEPHQWAPEMLAYGIETVPCFVYVNKRGRAIGKSATPTSKVQMLKSLQTLVRLGQQMSSSL